MKNVLGLMSLMAVGVCSSPAFAQISDIHIKAGAKELLGTVVLDKMGSAEVILPSMQCPSKENPPLQALELTVDNRMAVIDRVGIAFGDNTERVQIPINKKMMIGGSTGLMDLPGNNLCIDRIRIVGRTMSPDKALSQVRVYGYRNKNMYAGKQLDAMGSVSLNYGTNKQVLTMPACGKQNRQMDSLQLLVTGNDAQVDRLMIEFGNGVRRELAVANTFQNGTTSGVITIDNGNLRCIKQIAVMGRAITNGGQATVSFFGIRPEVISHTLATTKLERTKDIDLINLPACQNGMNSSVDAIQLVVGQNNARLNHITLSYQNGESETIAIQGVYQAGESTQVYDLSKGTRCVRGILVQGRTLVSKDVKQAIVQILGYTY